MQRLLAAILLFVLGANPGLALFLRTSGDDSDCAMSCCKRKLAAHCCKTHGPKAVVIKAGRPCGSGCAIPVAAPLALQAGVLPNSAIVSQHFAAELIAVASSESAHGNSFDASRHQRPPPASLF